MRIGKSNLNQDDELGDIVDSMPYNSEWAPGQLAGCDALGDVGVNVGVSPGGVNASGGFGWGTLVLIGAGFFLFKKYLK